MSRLKTLPGLLLAAAALLLSALLCARCQPTASPPPPRTTVQVPADQAWVNTEVRLEPGDILAVRYQSGLWSPWPGGAYDGVGFGGDPRCDCNVLQGISHAALLGKIGDGQPFYVGNEYAQPAGQAGVLFLGINDARLGDNSSSIVVEIRVTR